jgi:hypothetical protein
MELKENLQVQIKNLKNKWLKVLRGLSLKPLSNEDYNPQIKIIIIKKGIDNYDECKPSCRNDRIFIKW